MLEDKLRATDWEATNEAMEEAVARESYLEWLKDCEKRSRGTRTVVKFAFFHKRGYITLLRLASL